MGGYRDCIRLFTWQWISIHSYLGKVPGSNRFLRPPYYTTSPDDVTRIMVFGSEAGRKIEPLDSPHSNYFGLAEMVSRAISSNLERLLNHSIRRVVSWVRYLHKLGKLNFIHKLFTASWRNIPHSSSHSTASQAYPSFSIQKDMYPWKSGLAVACSCQALWGRLASLIRSDYRCS